jgi:hypothetical protein
MERNFPISSSTDQLSECEAKILEDPEESKIGSNGLENAYSTIGIDHHLGAYQMVILISRGFLHDKTLSFFIS